VSFEHTAPYTLAVRFDDATEQVIDFRPILAGEIYAPLRDLALFNQVRIDPEVHTLVWPNGADFDPETLHDWPQHADTPSRRAPAPGTRAQRRKARTETVADSPASISMPRQRRRSASIRLASCEVVEETMSDARNAAANDRAPRAAWSLSTPRTLQWQSPRVRLRVDYFARLVPHGSVTVRALCVSLRERSGAPAASCGTGGTRRGAEIATCNDNPRPLLQARSSCNGDPRFARRPPMP